MKKVLYALSTGLVMVCGDVLGATQMPSSAAIPACRTDITADLQSRIDAAWRSGGGSVDVPSGDWSVRSLRLRSGVVLHLEKDAHLWASRNPRDYDGILENDSVEEFAGYPVHLGKEDLSRRWENAIIKIFAATNVAITGESGSFIDGGNCADPNGEEGYRGPHGVWAACATNVALRNVTLRNTGNWATRFIHCADLSFEGMTSLGGHDGVHVRASDRVRIAGCRINTGDDSIAGYANRNVVVTNCTLRSACSPFRFGGRDVLIVDTKASGPADYPHRWTLSMDEKLRGAGPEEVAGRRSTGCAFQPFTDLRLRTWLRPGNIVFRNVTFENANRFMVFMNGLGAIWQDGVPIEDIVFENCAIRGMALPSVLYAPEKHPLKLVFRNCYFSFTEQWPAAFLVKNVSIVAENVRTANAGVLAMEKDGLSYDDVPEFPSWRIESAGQRAKWGLPPLKTASSDHELVVSPDGMSPRDALLAIRAAKSGGDKGAWVVRVREGQYTLNEPLVFTPEDSGEPDAPVTWIGDGDKAMFAGGRRLTGWKDIGGGVWAASIPPAPDGSPAYFDQLWVNGRRADRARLPNSVPENPVEGYLSIAAADISPVINEAGKVTYVERTSFSNSTELASISADEFALAQLCVIHKWSFARRVVKSVDPATLTVETHSPEDQAKWRKWEPGVTIAWFENVRSAFDAPGEWFYDAKNGAVLYRPLPGEDMSMSEVVAPSSELSRLVEFRGDPNAGAYVHDILFKDISFAFTSATSSGGRGPVQSYQYQAARHSDGAVTVMGARRLSLDSCRISHTGNYGMRFDDGCTSNAVTNCEFDDLGAGGVWMGAQKGYVADDETLSRRIITTLAPRSTAFNRIENCLIRGGGKYNPEGPGVALTHVSDSKVLNCEICDFMYTGVSVGFVWGFKGSVAQRNEIAFNKIYDLGKGVMSDMGGVYTLATSFGTIVHDNVIHDVWAYAYGGWALYADEGSEGIVMERNLCWNTTDGGFHQHFGSGCIVRNNIFAWNKKLGAVRTGRQVVDDIPCSLHFVNNIVVVREGPLVGEGARGVGGVWAGNLWYDYSGRPELDGLDWNAWKDCGKEVCGAYADPRFEDADANDFRLKPGSLAFALGFKPWDFSRAGRRRAYNLKMDNKEGE